MDEKLNRPKKERGNTIELPKDFYRKLRFVAFYRKKTVKEFVFPILEKIVRIEEKRIKREERKKQTLIDNINLNKNF